MCVLSKIETSSFFIMRRWRRFCESVCCRTAGATGYGEKIWTRAGFFFVFFDYCYYYFIRTAYMYTTQSDKYVCCDEGFSFVFFLFFFCSACCYILIRTSSPPVASTTRIVHTYRYLPCAVTRWYLQMCTCHACGQKVYNVYTRRFVIIDDEISDVLTEPRADKTLVSSKCTHKLLFIMSILL